MAWCATEELQQRLPDVYPALPHVRWLMNLCAKCVSGRQNEREPLTECPLQVEKSTNSNWAWSQRKTMTCFPVCFSSRRKSSVPQDIAQESPFLLMETMEPSKQGCLLSIKASDIKDNHSRFNVHFFRCTRFILTEKFGGWSALLIDAENLHLWSTDVLRVRNTDCLLSFAVRPSPTPRPPK